MKEQQRIMLAALTDWKRETFVPITNHYGGYQGWLSSEICSGKITQKFLADRACGVAAATNVVFYLSEHHKDKKKLLSTHSKDRSGFALQMKDIMKYIRPQIWGIPFLSTLTKGLQKYAIDQGMDLSVRRLRLAWIKPQLEEVISFIVSGLNQNTPIVLLTWNITDSDLSDLKYHWVTVTALYEEAGEYWIITSNWGQMRTYSLSRWVKAGSWYRGLAFFR